MRSGGRLETGFAMPGAYRENLHQLDYFRLGELPLPELNILIVDPGCQISLPAVFTLCVRFSSCIFPYELQKEFVIVCPGSLQRFPLESQRIKQPNAFFGQNTLLAFQPLGVTPASQGIFAGCVIHRPRPPFRFFFSERLQVFVPLQPKIFPLNHLGSKWKSDGTQKDHPFPFQCPPRMPLSLFVEPTTEPVVLREFLGGIRPPFRMLGAELLQAFELLFPITIHEPDREFGESDFLEQFQPVFLQDPCQEGLAVPIMPLPDLGAAGKAFGWMGPASVQLSEANYVFVLDPPPLVVVIQGCLRRLGLHFGFLASGFSVCLHRASKNSNPVVGYYRASYPWEETRSTRLPPPEGAPSPCAQPLPAVSFVPACAGTTAGLQAFRSEPLRACRVAPFGSRAGSTRRGLAGTYTRTLRVLLLHNVVYANPAGAGSGSFQTFA